MGQYSEALREAEKLVELAPDFALAYYQISFNNQFLDHLNLAAEALKRAAARRLETPEFFEERYDLAFLHGDQAEMDREVALSRGKPGVEDWLLDQEAFRLAYSGELQQAKVKSGQAVDLALKASQRDRAALWKIAPALWDALFGDYVEARRGAMASLALSDSQEVEYGAALAVALSRDTFEAQRLTNDLERRFPEDTAVRYSYLPVLHALLALPGDPAKAVAVLQEAVPYEFGVPSSIAVGFPRGTPKTGHTWTPEKRTMR